MSSKTLLFISVAFIGILVKKCLDTVEFISLPHGFTFNDDHCELAGVGLGMIGSEDMALGKHSVLFVTSGDLKSVFEHGAASATPGGLWVYDMRSGGSPNPIKLELESFPSNKRFQGHGLDVSNSTDRVYAISHNGPDSSVDIFQILYHDECLASLPWSCNPVSLLFFNSVSSSLFPNSGINDVIEAGPNQVYVTQWQPFPFPSR